MQPSTLSCLCMLDVFPLESYRLHPEPSPSSTIYLTLTDTHDPATEGRERHKYPSLLHPRNAEVVTLRYRHAEVLRGRAQPFQAFGVFIRHSPAKWQVPERYIHACISWTSLGEWHGGWQIQPQRARGKAAKTSPPTPATGQDQIGR